MDGPGCTLNLDGPSVGCLSHSTPNHESFLRFSLPTQASFLNCITLSALQQPCDLLSPVSSFRFLNISSPVPFDPTLPTISLELIYELAVVMEQIPEQLLLNPFRSLDAAAKETTTALARANIRHGFIGGYATSLLGGVRLTSVRFPYILSIFDTIPPANLIQDLDVIVDADPSDTRNLLLQAHSGFRLSQSNKLVFTFGDESIPIELLRGGRTRQLKLPDANAVSILSITANDRPGRIDNTPS